MRSLLLLLLPFAACTTPEPNSETQTAAATTTDTASTVATTPETIAGCYVLANNKDTAYLQLSAAGDSLQGHLQYQLSGKDRNTGTIVGTIEGDMINAYYHFMSEGVLSVRQVVFKIKGNRLVEGFGDVEQRNDTTQYEDESTLQFKYDRFFQKDSCAGPAFSGTKP